MREPLRWKVRLEAMEEVDRIARYERLSVLVRTVRCM